MARSDELESPGQFHVLNLEFAEDAGSNRILAAAEEGGPGLRSGRP